MGLFDTPGRLVCRLRPQNRRCFGSMVCSKKAPDNDEQMVPQGRQGKQQCRARSVRESKCWRRWHRRLKHEPCTSMFGATSDQLATSSRRLDDADLVGNVKSVLVSHQANVRLLLAVGPDKREKDVSVLPTANCQQGMTTHSLTSSSSSSTSAHLMRVLTFLVVMS